jgi:hypothetical protein
VAALARSGKLVFGNKSVFVYGFSLAFNPVELQNDLFKQGCIERNLCSVIDKTKEKARFFF